MLAEYMHNTLHRMRDLDDKPFSSDPQTRMSIKMNGRTCTLTLTGTEARFVSHGWKERFPCNLPAGQFVGELCCKEDTVQAVNSVVQSGQGYDRLTLFVFESFGNPIPTGRIGPIGVVEIPHVYGGDMKAWREFLTLALSDYEGVVIRDSIGGLARYKPRKTCDLLIIGATPDGASVLAAGQVWTNQMAVVAHVPIHGEPLDLPDLEEQLNHVDRRGVRFRAISWSVAAEFGYAGLAEPATTETFDVQLRRNGAAMVGRLISPSFIRMRPEKLSPEIGLADVPEMLERFPAPKASVEDVSSLPRASLRRIDNPDMKHVKGIVRVANAHCIGASLLSDNPKHRDFVRFETTRDLNNFITTIGGLPE